MSLENKVDRKQWIPVLGLGKAVYDTVKKKPSLFEGYNPKAGIKDNLKNATITALYLSYQIYASTMTLYGIDQIIKYFSK